MLLFLLQVSSSPVVWYKDPITVATFVIALAAIASAVISERLRGVTAEYVRVTKDYAQATKEMLHATQESLQATKDMLQVTKENLRVTKDIFEAAHRPYVGVFQINTELRRTEGIFSIELHYHNVGSVAANEFTSSLTCTLDGTVLPMTHLDKDAIGVLLPAQVQIARYSWHDHRIVDHIISGKRLAASFSCTYKGVTQQEYRYEQESVFHVDYGRFYVTRAFST